MEGEGEANRTEKSVEPRGGRGAKVVDDEAELGADRRCEVGVERRREVVGRMAGSKDILYFTLYPLRDLLPKVRKTKTRLLD